MNFINKTINNRPFQPEFDMGEYYSHLFNCITDPVFVLDSAGNYIDVNEAACIALGYRRDELLLLTPCDLETPEFARQMPQRIKQILKHGTLTYESAKLRRDGSIMNYEMSARLIKHDHLRLIIATARDITKRKKAENQLASQKNYFEALFRSSTDAIVSLDHNHLVMDINPRFEELFGYTLGDLKGKNLDHFINPSEKPGECRDLTCSVLKGQSVALESIRRRQDGSIINVLVRGTPICMENRIIGVLGLYTDISARITANKKLLEAHKLQQEIIDFLPDPTFVINREGTVIAWNRAMEKISGVRKEEIIGQGDNAYSKPFYGGRRAALLNYLLTRDECILEHYQHVRRMDNKIFAEAFAPEAYCGRGAYLWITASPLFDRDGNLTGVIESIRDISEQKEREHKLEFLSWHDPLTGMYNRTFFEHKIQNLELPDHVPITIITCDVDGLKLINDIMGHNAGDKLLKSAAGVIRDSIRTNDIAARIGGDEFAILLTGTDQLAGSKICQRIKQAIDQHNRSNALPLSISMGMATTTDNPDTGIIELFKEADNKMYLEKLTRSKSARSTVVQALMTALEARDFVTEGHCNRLSDLATRLGMVIGLAEDRYPGLRLLAHFHDIGKVGVPDQILFKPGPLTAEETVLMQLHCEIGHRIAMAAPDLAPIADLILKHHEWWNGQGYPLGLKRLEIPLECRILTIVDAYDAMSSNRPYRKALHKKQVIDELLKCAGTQFDPHLVNKFVKLI